jgi:hypothetical protein
MRMILIKTLITQMRSKLNWISRIKIMGKIQMKALKVRMMKMKQSQLRKLGSRKLI